MFEVRQQDAEVCGFAAAAEVGKDTNQTLGRCCSCPRGIESLTAVGAVARSKKTSAGTLTPGASAGLYTSIARCVVPDTPYSTSEATAICVAGGANDSGGGALD